jgi:hypothetical protein
MVQYKAVKNQYENLKLRLSELEILEEQARDAWCKADYNDKKKYKKIMEAEDNTKEMRKCIRAVVYDLVVLEHKELGTSLTKLAKEYGTTIRSIKKLLEKNGVEHIRPTAMKWLPIETAPWLEPIIATWKNNKGTPVVCMICKHLIHTAVDSPLSETLNLGRMVYYWSIDMSGEEQLEVNPTHWMPMPDPPGLKEKTNGR